MTKIITLNQLPKKKGLIILTGGCFDVLHKGHFEFLKKTKALGGTLFIALESDETVKRLKGKNRPVNSQYKRALTLSKLPSVDYIIPIPSFKKDEEYFSLVKKIEPDIIAVTENDPLLGVKRKQAKTVGGKVVEVIKRLKGYSTTEILREKKKKNE